MRAIKPSRSIVADGAYTLAIRLLNLFFSAALGILTARMLGPYGRGIYSLPMVNAALVTASYSGLTSATSYMLLRHANHRGVLLRSLGAAAVFISVGALCTTGLAALNRHLWAAVPAMISLPGTALLLVCYGYAIGTHRVRINSTLAAVNSLGLIGVMALAFTVLGRAPQSAIIAWVAATTVLGLGCLAWMLRDAPSPDASERESTPTFPATLAFAGRAGLVGLVSLLNYRADVYLVALFASPAALGIYTIAVSAAEALLTMTQVTSVVTQARVGSLPLPEAADFTARCVRHNVLVALVACGAIFAIAPIVIGIIYGSAFTGVVAPLRVLLFGVFALSLGAPISNYFTIRLGRPEVALALASISAAVCIALSIELIPRYGLVGAATASTVAYCIGQCSAFVYFSKTTQVHLLRLLVPRASDAAVYARFLHWGRTDQHRGETSNYGAANGLK